jgi:hypothetical protein
LKNRPYRIFASLALALGVLVSNTHAYDITEKFSIGGAAEWEIGNFDITAMGMNIGENDDGYSYHFFAARLPTGWRPLWAKATTG